MQDLHFDQKEQRWSPVAVASFDEPFMTDEVTFNTCPEAIEEIATETEEVIDGVARGRI